MSYPSTPPQHDRPPTNRMEAARVLCIAPDAPLAVAEAAWRALSKTTHPDTGGSVVAMAHLNVAIDLIRSTPAPVAPVALDECRRQPADARMPWGKFRGQSMAAVPLGYLGWLVESCDDHGIRLAAALTMHARSAYWERVLR